MCWCKRGWPDDVAVTFELGGLVDDVVRKARFLVLEKSQYDLDFWWQNQLKKLELVMSFNDGIDVC